MPGPGFRSYVALVLAAALLAGCTSAGTRSIAFVTPEIGEAYIPLYMGTRLGSSRFAAAVVVAPNVAVTNDHNLNLLSEYTVIARSPAYDLLFFRTERTRVPLIASPKIGQTVIAYGQDGQARRKEAKGVVRELNARAIALCGDCPERPTITYDADAGVGFSGGPVVDAASGAVVGITVGYLDGAAEDGGRRMYAMDMDFVMAEMRRLVPGGIAAPAP
jgi:S1-C subfamily serine protease